MSLSPEHMVNEALAGDLSAMRRLVDQLAPVVHARVGRVLVAFGASRHSRDIRQDVEDLTQEVFAELFEDDARVLRSWHVERGASLQGFVALVAQRYAISRLRSRKRQSWNELSRVAPDDVDQDPVALDPSPEAVVASREVLEEVIRQLRKELSPKGDALFRLLILEQRPHAEVVERTGLSSEAVYMWRSLLVKSARKIAEKISLETPRPPRKANEH